MMIDIQILGTCGSMPTPGRFLTSMLISFKGKKILIDCGEGTQVAMKMLNTGFKSIDLICITHTHADHILGLPGLLATIRNSERTEPLTIIGPKGVKKAIEGLMVIVPHLGFDLNIIENPNDKIHFSDNFEINTLHLDHTIPCLGYNFLIRRNPKFDVNKAMKNEIPKTYWSRLQKGEIIEDEGRIYTPDLVLGEERKGIKVSYITDTRPTPAIPNFIAGSDLFICEGMYGADEDLEKAIRNKHMTFKEAATLAEAGQVKELILTHFSPSIQPELYIENAKAVFPKSMCGYDGLTRQLKFIDE